MRTEDLKNIKNKRYDVEINLSPQKGGIVIGDKFYPNMLVSNYWRLLTGVLREINVDVKNTSGTNITANVGNRLNAGWTASIEFGTSDDPSLWGQFSLLASNDSIEGALGVWTKSLLTDEIELSLGRAAANTTVKEVALYQTIYNSADAAHTVMLGRAVPSTPPNTGQTVLYKIKIQRPWVENFADFLLGFMLKGENRSARNLAGTTITMRGITADCGAGPIRLYAGTGTGAQAWTNYTLTAAQRMTETYTHINDANYNQLSVSGFLRPTAPVTIGEVGVVGYIFDTSSVAHEVLFARSVLPTPILVPAGELFTAMVQIYAQ